MVYSRSNSLYVLILIFYNASANSSKSLQSPRWLLTKDRVEEAREALEKLRKEAFTDEEIAEEFSALQFALALEPEQGKYHEIFQGTNLKRTGIIVAMNFLQQATGQSFATSYGTVFVKRVGSVNPFDMTIINSAVNFFMVGVNLCLNDWAGRRYVRQTASAAHFESAVMILFVYSKLKFNSILTRLQAPSSYRRPVASSCHLHHGRSRNGCESDHPNQESYRRHATHFYRWICLRLGSIDICHYHWSHITPSSRCITENRINSKRRHRVSIPEQQRSYQVTASLSLWFS